MWINIFLTCINIFSDTVNFNSYISNFLKNLAWSQKNIQNYNKNVRQKCKKKNHFVLYNLKVNDKYKKIAGQHKELTL